MRIPYPERIPYSGAIIAAFILFAAQFLEHTSIYFSLCCFAFIVLVTAAFNIAGGLYRPAGAYIFFNAVLTLLVGLATKAALFEPADSNLYTPMRSIQVYTLGALGMLVAAYLENRFRKPIPLVAKLFPLANLRTAYIGSAIIGISARILYTVQPVSEAGSVYRAFQSFDQFVPFSMILGVMYTVRASNGKRSLSPGLAIILIGFTLFGLVTFSKQAIYTPAFCWVMGVALERYNLRPPTLVLSSVIFFVLFYYGSAYSQVGREYRQGVVLTDAGIAWRLVTHMGQVLQENKNANVVDEGAAYRMAYFNQSEGLLDRLQMFSPDDALIFTTDRDGQYGYEPLKEYFENLIPHFIWPDKPVPYFGNVYAHQIGILDVEDTSTGISFGISGELYHMGGFLAVLLGEPAILALPFLVLSRILGDVRDHPVGLVAVLIMAHYAPEGGAGCAIIFIQISIVLVVLAFTCNYVLPIFASVFEPHKPLSQLPVTAVSAG